MRLPRGVRRLFRLGTFRRDVERDLDDELGFHRQKLVEQLLRDGMTEQHAKALARERFGDERAYREALRRIDTGRVRMRERSEFVDVVVGLWSQAVRSLYRSPGLTLAIVVILALGIGANAVMFGVVDRLLLSPPQHVDDWEQLRHLYLKRTIFNGDVSTGRTLTYPDYDDLTRVSGWSSVAAYTTSQALTVGRGEGAQRERTVKASASLFPLLGVQPVIGRTFSVEEDLAGAPPTAVLAHEFWERRYGADESVLGSSLDIGRGTYTVIGIMPPGFTGAELEPVDIWLPLETAQAIEEQNVDWHDTRNWWWLRTVARLSAEATDEATTAQATALHRRGQAEQIEADRYDSAAEIISAPIIAARGPTPTAEA
ncbi:MAG: ABC transporter permease, partial [Gemmatimonadetes bacterium]|nr:ABC transporter permease [Gemmatimonadota bacterium]